MYALTTIVETVPETMTFLRDMLYRRPTAKPEGAENVTGGSGFGPSVPINLDAMQAADLELESLAYWAREIGCDMSNLGPVWRVNGDIRGVLYDSPLAAKRLTERVLARLTEPHFTPPADMADRMADVRAGHCRRFPPLQDFLAHAEETNGDAYDFD
ncbi:hypothetical protein [Rhodococcus sp. NBC_00297]|uniref:hypothetical protein n=1 Tax=Rhodococcus sp. NBC_00297 TaxID=2976005 RepID=UPI002E2BE80F|nr:hypothetical protein [Rhodococcus sp. NBC_00297]